MVTEAAQKAEWKKKLITLNLSYAMITEKFSERVKFFKAAILVLKTIVDDLKEFLEHEAEVNALFSFELLKQMGSKLSELTESEEETKEIYAVIFDLISHFAKI